MVALVVAAALSMATAAQASEAGAGPPEPAAAPVARLHSFTSWSFPRAVVTPKPRPGAPLAIYTSGELADYLTTARMRSAGWKEANPYLRIPLPALAVAKVGFVAALTALDMHAQRSRHVKVERVAYVVGRVALTAWNLRQGSGLHTVTERPR